MDRPSNTKQISQQPDVTRQGLKHKIDITVAQCQMKSAWDTKQVSQHPNVTWTGLGIQNIYHTNLLSNGKCLEQKTGITPTKCQMDRTLNTKQVPQQPNVMRSSWNTKNITAV